MGIHELFPELPRDPKEAENLIRQDIGKALHDLVLHFFAASAKSVLDKWQLKQSMSEEQLRADWLKTIKTPLQDFNRAAREVHRFFEPEDSPALPLWKELIKDALNAGLADHENAVTQPRTIPFVQYASFADLIPRLEKLAREVAKLDGFDVVLRSLSIDQQTPLDRRQALGDACTGLGAQ